jgi:hypothetical protein
MNLHTQLHDRQPRGFFTPREKLITDGCKFDEKTGQWSDINPRVVSISYDSFRNGFPRQMTRDQKVEPIKMVEKPYKEKQGFYRQNLPATESRSRPVVQTLKVGGTRG